MCFTVSKTGIVKNQVNLIIFSLLILLNSPTVSTIRKEAHLKRENTVKGRELVTSKTPQKQKLHIGIAR